MKRVLSRVIFTIGLAHLAFTQLGLAGDIGFFGIVKEQTLIQTGTGAPVLDGSTPFRFQCFVDSTGPDLITDATLRLPSSASRILSPDGDSGYTYQDVFSSASALNSIYGVGTYTLTIESENDLNVAQLSMPSLTFPNAPQITNYASAQVINPGNSFRIGWLPFSGGSSGDYIEFTIRDGFDNAVFRSGDLGTAGALNGTSNSIVIPAEALFPGETYRGEVHFAKIVTRDTTSIPNAQGVVAFVSRTSFSVKTTGQVLEVNLQVIGLVGGEFQLRFNTQPGKAYQVQFADSLPNWQNFLYTNAASSEVVVKDNAAGSSPKRFFRVMVP